MNKDFLTGGMVWISKKKKKKRYYITLKCKGLYTNLQTKSDLYTVCWNHDAVYWIHSLPLWDTEVTASHLNENISFDYMSLKRAVCSCLLAPSRE